MPRLQINQQDKTPYSKVMFKFETEFYKWGEGHVSTENKINSQNAIQELINHINNAYYNGDQVWKTVDLQREPSECIYAVSSKDNSILYLHPQDFSGYLSSEALRVFDEALKECSTKDGVLGRQFNGYEKKIFRENVPYYTTEELGAIIKHACLHDNMFLIDVMTTRDPSFIDEALPHVDLVLEKHGDVLKTRPLITPSALREELYKTNKKYDDIEIPMSCVIKDFSEINVRDDAIKSATRKDPNEYYQVIIEVNDKKLDTNYSTTMLKLYEALNNAQNYASKWIPNNPQMSGEMVSLLNTINHSRIYLHPRELSCTLTAPEFQRLINAFKEAEVLKAVNTVRIVAKKLPYYEEQEFQKICDDILSDKKLSEKFIYLGKTPSGRDHDCAAIIPRVQNGFDLERVVAKAEQMLFSPHKTLYAPNEKPMENIHHNSLRYHSMVKKIEKKFPELSQERDR